MEEKIRVGSNFAGNSVMLGDPNGKIKALYVDGSAQYAKNDFKSTLNRFGCFNNITHGDVQQAVLRLMRP